MAFAKIHEAVHVCSLVGEQKYVQRFVALENAEMHCRKQRYAGQHNIRLRRLRRGPDVGANGLKMVIYDQVLSERLLQFNDVCRCQLVIADDVGFAKALNRVLFCNINGVGVADVVEIVHEWLPLYMLTCAHIEQRLMPNPQRFEGLEEDKITWYSNRYSAIFECR